MFNLETDRLFFRNWNFNDLVILYALAKNPNVGPCAGWKPHETIEESAEVLKKFVKRENLFAICLKSTGKIIGAIEIKNKERSKLIEGPNECEFGFWIGYDYWGNGYMTETVMAFLDYCFNSLNMNSVWCAYYEGNYRSKRVQEKCGFRPIRIAPNPVEDPIRRGRDSYINCITRAQWLADNS